jgi:putative flippase GtrA
MSAVFQDAIRFTIVGAAGFVFDAGTVYATAPWLGLYGAGLLAYVVAATFTWFANRTWTFRSQPPRPKARQWALFLAANSLGFVLNRGTYMALIALVPLCRTHPVLAVIAGSLAGLVSNFVLSRRIVFR